MKNVIRMCGFLNGKDYFINYQMLDRVFANIYIVNVEDNRNFVRDLAKCCEKLTIFKDLNKQQIYRVVDSCVDYFVDRYLLNVHLDSEFKNGKVSWYGRKFEIEETFKDYPKRWFDNQGRLAINSLNANQKTLLYDVYRGKDVFCDVKDKFSLIALNVTGAELEGLGLIDIKPDDTAKFGLRYEKTLFGLNALNNHLQAIKNKQAQADNQPVKDNQLSKDTQPVKDNQFAKEGNQPQKDEKILNDYQTNKNNKSQQYNQSSKDEKPQYKNLQQNKQNIKDNQINKDKQVVEDKKQDSQEQELERE